MFWTLEHAPVNSTDVSCGMSDQTLSGLMDNRAIWYSFYVEAEWQRVNPLSDMTSA